VEATFTSFANSVYPALQGSNLNDVNVASPINSCDRTVPVRDRCLFYADTLPIRERFESPHDGQTSPPQCVQYLDPQMPHLYTEKDLSEGLEELPSAARVQLGQLLKMCMFAPFLTVVEVELDTVEWGIPCKFDIWRRNFP